MLHHVLLVALHIALVYVAIEAGELINSWFKAPLLFLQCSYMQAMYFKRLLEGMQLWNLNHLCLIDNQSYMLL